MSVMKISENDGHRSSTCFDSCAALRLVFVLVALWLVLNMSPVIAQPQLVSDGETTQSNTDIAETRGTPEDGSAKEAARIEAEKAAATARSREISREIARREALIDELRYSSGVYSDELREVQADLGAYLIDVDDFEKAAEVYAEALQIARINTGLYSEEQLPLIEALIVSNEKVKAWPKADDFQSLHLHIVGRLYSKTDGRFLSTARQYGEWRFRVMSENLLEDSYQGLARTAEDLSTFYGSLIIALESEGLANSGDLLDFVFSKADTDLVLIRAIASAPYTDFPGTASPYVYQSRCRNVRDVNGQVVQRCTNIQIENPRYRQSQRDAKQVAVNRQVRHIREAIERIERLRDSAPQLDSEDIDVLDSRIARLELETQQLLRKARSRSLF